MKKDIADWLREFLRTHGETDCETVKEEAYCAGYSKSELKDARLICMIKSVSKTFWKLPEDRS